MRKLILIICTVLIFSSCASIKLKGSYPPPNYFTETDLSFEEVWGKVIDYFAVNGVPITTIDKSSGLIVSSKMSFVNYYSREDRGGKPIDSMAYVVIPTVRGGFGNVLEPTANITGGWVMIGDWNVRVKAVGDRTIINVNLMNIDCYYSTSSIYGSNVTKIPIKSTGIFETQLMEIFK